MALVLILIAIIEMAAGVLIYGASRSAIHEIYAATSFGFGGVTLGLGFVVAKLGQIRDRLPGG